MLYFTQHETLTKTKKEWEEFNVEFEEKTKQIVESLIPLKGKFVTVKVEEQNSAGLYRLWEVGGRLMIMRLEEEK